MSKNKITYAMSATLRYNRYTTKSNYVESEYTMIKSIAVILVVLGIIAAAVIFGKGEDVAGVPSNNTYGNTAATVTLTEYGDFECPACAAFFPIVDQVKTLYEDRVKFEFKHFPLVQIHPNATAAHRAAEAAAKQGKFWEMHDLLYERQASWRASGPVSHNGTRTSTNVQETFEQYARELNLNMEQYTADFRAAETLATINADIAEGKDNGATGTPTFILNGNTITDTSTIDSVEEFSAVLEQALAVAAEAPALNPAETPPATEPTDTTPAEATP